MSNRQSFPETIRDDARIRGIRGGHDPVMPDGPELGLVGVDRDGPDPGPAAPTQATMVEQWRRPATVTAVECETATAKVDDWRIAIGKILPDAWGGAGTELDAHVDFEQHRVWLRPSYEPPPPCDCPHDCEDDGDTRSLIPGVAEVLEGAAEVQSKHRVKLQPNLVRLLGGSRDAGGITAIAVGDLDAVLLLADHAYLRRLMPELTQALPDNVIAMPDSHIHHKEQTS